MNRSLVLLILSALLLSVPTGAASEELHFLAVGYSQDLLSALNNEIIPKFEQEHGVDVTIEHVGWGNRVERITILTVSGMSPDVVSTGYYSPYEEGSKGLLAPLDKYLEIWENTQKIPQPLWETQSWRGSVYVMPQYFDIRGIAYNKNLFAEAGYGAEDTPQSWDELLQYTKRLTRLDANGQRVEQRGFSFAFNGAQNLFWFMMQAGIDPIDVTTLTSNLNRPETADALQFLQELYVASKGNLPGPGNSGVELGQTAMGMKHPGMMNPDPSLAKDVGVFAPRMDPSTDPVSIAFINGLAIPDASDNKDLAWKLIAYLMSEEVQLQVCEITNWVSPRIDLVDELVFRLSTRYFYDLVPFLRAPVIPPPRNTAQEEVTKAVQQVLNMEMSPQEALVNSHDLWTQLLAEWRAAISN